MNLQVLAAIRQGGVEEIINLFSIRAESAQRCAELDQLMPLHPELWKDFLLEKKVVQTIDNYMRDKLQPVCRINGELILAFPDQCQACKRMGIAPGDLDITEAGQRFINPSLPGFVVWGVFDRRLSAYEVMPAMTIQHFSTDDIGIVQNLSLSY